MGKITNTEAEAHTHAGKVDILLKAQESVLKGGGPTDFIPEMEKAGQAELVKASTGNKAQLPRDGFFEDRYLGEGETPAKEFWMSQGIVFDEDDGKDIFVTATLPEGWRIKATEHDMWTHLVDEKDRKRASIFYKAAFYDRSAHGGADRRYSTSSKTLSGKYDDTEPSYGIVLDGTTEIHRLGPFDTDPISEERADQGHVFPAEGGRADEKARRAANAWLTENFPEWQDIGAYWD